MVIITRDTPAEQPRKPVSVSFGDDPERYDRARPRYPRELIERIVAGRPGRTVLDVGCGTGIAARQFRAAGCEVTGVEPDERMAAFAARRHGLAVEVAKFEEWDPAGRRFDTLTAGMTWHWVDAAAGAEQAARVLRPGGRIALFWNAFRVPPDLVEAFARAYAELLPDQPMYQHGLRAGTDVYAPLLTSTAERLGESGFEHTELWRDEWQQTYTRAAWLDLFPTFGGHALLARETVAALQEAIGAEVDAVGGKFVVDYATVTVTAIRKAD